MVGTVVRPLILGVFLILLSQVDSRKWLPVGTTWSEPHPYPNLQGEGQGEVSVSYQGL